jgi:serine protease Do
MGTYSVAPRTTKTGKQSRLGVDPDEVPGGVMVSEILPNTSAYLAGLINGDIITSIDGDPIRSVSQLVNAIRKNAPGDTIRIEYLRNGVANTTKAILDSFDISGDRAKRYKMMSRLGAIPSRRADNFPSVFQHDAPLFPEQCGGPVVDLDGKIIGINIARNGRAATYAIPLENVQRLVQEFLREAVAVRE